MISEKFMVNSEEGRMEAARYVAEDFAGQAKLDKRQTLQVCLLAEETLGMVKTMLSDYTGQMWFEGDDSRCEIHLKAAAKMDSEKKHELLSVSSTGKNAAAKGFMGALGEFISNSLYNVGAAIDACSEEAFRYGCTGMSGVNLPNIYDMTPVWTLEHYKASIAEMKEASWDDLEKSIVANIADDVIVGVKGKDVELVIVKRFKDASKAEDDQPVVTDKLLVNRQLSRVLVANDVAEDVAWHCRLNPKDTMRLCLLVEETIGMVRAMTDDFEGQLWLEGSHRTCRIHLEATASMNAKEKRSLISASTTGKNAAPQGFMAKLGDMIANALTYDDGVEFAGFASDGMPEYINYGVISPLHEPSMMHSWSLVAYRSALQNEQAKDPDAADALNELEKSIVAKLADDVTVGVKGKHIELVITKNFEA